MWQKGHPFLVSIAIVIAFPGKADGKYPQEFIPHALPRGGLLGTISAAPAGTSVCPDRAVMAVDPLKVTAG
jgi:hypothetical protein